MYESYTLINNQLSLSISKIHILWFFSLVGSLYVYGYECKIKIKVKETSAFTV